MRVAGLNKSQALVHQAFAARPLSAAAATAPTARKSTFAGSRIAEAIILSISSRRTSIRAMAMASSGECLSRASSRPLPRTDLKSPVNRTINVNTI